MARFSWLVLLISACVQPPPIVVPECGVAQRLEFDVAQPSQRLTVSNAFDAPRVVTIAAPPAPFSVEPMGILRLEPHEVREVIVRYSPAITADVSWEFIPSAGCEPVELTLSGVAGDAAVSASPGRLDFGSLPASPRSLTLRNHTHAAVEVRSLAFSNPAFSSTTSVPLTIPALSSVELIVEARGAGALDGTLTINTEALVLGVPLLANRTGPCLIASRSAVDFGTIELACRGHDELVSVTNTCPHAVRDVSGLITSGFSIVAGAPSKVLEPSASASFIITTSLSSPAESTGTFSVSADVLDGIESTATQLSAVRTPVRMIEETYTNPRPKRDVLIVLDDSPSMLPFADALRTSVNYLAHDLVGNQEIVHLGVMTTSTALGEIGRLRRTSSGRTWLENPTVEEINAHVTLSGTSTARSSCLEVLHEAFSTRAEIGPMLQPQAYLQVICITSQADGLQTPATPLVASLFSLIPRPSGIIVIANFYDRPGCTAVRDTGALGALVELSNGRQDEICEPQWWLDDRIVYFGGFRTNFYLSERPDLTRAPIALSVDGMPLPDDEHLWTYEAANNSVILEPLYVPGYDQTLRMRYAPFCQ